MLSRFVLACILFAAVATARAQTPAAKPTAAKPTAPPGAESVFEVGNMFPGWVEPEDGPRLKERSILGSEAMAILYGMPDLVERNDWVMLDGVIEAHRTTTAEADLYLVDQTFGRHMLMRLHRMCPDACDDLKRKYVGLLLDAGSPTAGLNEVVLDGLIGLVPDAEIRRMRAQAIGNAERWMRADAMRRAVRAKADLGIRDMQRIAGAMDMGRARIRESVARMRASLSEDERPSVVKLRG